jgi:hypothetical protein
MWKVIAWFLRWAMGNPTIRLPMVIIFLSIFGYFIWRYGIPTSEMSMDDQEASIVLCMQTCEGDTTQSIVNATNSIETGYLAYGIPAKLANQPQDMASCEAACFHRHLIGNIQFSVKHHYGLPH